MTKKNQLVQANLQWAGEVCERQAPAQLLTAGSAVCVSGTLLGRHSLQGSGEITVSVCTLHHIKLNAQEVQTHCQD